MKIAIASLGDPSSATTWSGIPASIFSELRHRGHEVIPIALVKPREPWHFAWRRRFHHRVEKKWFLGAVEKIWLEKISRQLDKEVKRIRPRVVLVIHADWLAYSTFDCPACIIHDTTFDSIAGYYPSFSNLSRRSLRNGHIMYQRAIDKCAAAIYPAAWATKSAINRYRLPASKAFTVPFGANIDHLPDVKQVDDWIEQRTQSTECHFLFIGTQWKRKGGPDVLRFISTLNKLGVKADLTIVGCVAEIPVDMERHVRQVGYLRKDDPSELTVLDDLFARSHAVIVLSKAECYGCVFCEANAYGLPAIGRDTGGVPEIIHDGVNGMLLRPQDTVNVLAIRWASLWSNRVQYQLMCHNAYLEFKGRLNTKAFVNRLDSILADVLTNHN